MIRRFRRPSDWTLSQTLEHYSIPEPNSGCILWTGASLNRDGYGALHWEGRPNAAHRLSWMNVHGPVPDGMSVCHKCDTPACVNPDHLFLGTHQENMADRDRKGRQYDRKAERNGRAKLTTEEVAALRSLKGTKPAYVLAAEFGIGPSQARRILRGEQWT